MRIAWLCIGELDMLATMPDRPNTWRRLLGKVVLCALVLGCDFAGTPVGDPTPPGGEAQPTNPAPPGSEIGHANRDTILAIPGRLIGPLLLQLPARSDTSQMLLLRASKGATVAPPITSMDTRGTVAVQQWFPALTGAPCDSLEVVADDATAMVVGTLYACVAVELTLDRSTVLLAPGDRTPLKLSVSPEGAKVAQPLHLLWQSADTSVAVVDTTGLVTAHRVGMTRVTVSIGAVRTSTNLTVVDPEQLSGPVIVARTTVTPTEAFVAWTPPAGLAAPGAIWSRPLGSSAWQRSEIVPDQNHRTLSGWPAGTRLQVALALTDPLGGVLAARLDTMTAGDGAACQALTGRAIVDSRLFCNAADLREWVAGQGLSPDNVLCRSLALSKAGNDLPNCVWEAGSERLLLLRGLGDEFRPTPPLPLGDLQAAYRRILFGGSTPEATIWQLDPAIGQPAPETRVGSVQGYQSAVSWVTNINYVGSITYFEPPNPNGAIAIYHEGHGGDATDIGAETISWLLARGWSVVALNMPRVPHMWVRDFHTGEGSPIWRMLYGIGQVTEWIHRSWAPGRNPVVVAIGRSGGAWTSLLYSALDPRISATVVVSGFEPVTQRLASGGVDIGDWEQAAPGIFGVLDYTDIVRLAATRPLLLTFDEDDPCCFRKTLADPFVQWLMRDVPASGGKVTTIISDEGLHGLSTSAYSAIANILDSVLMARH